MSPDSTADYDTPDAQMTRAIRRQMEQREHSQHIDRSGWTRQQWIDDARALMDHPDGAITSLVNGHVLALLNEAQEAAEWKVAGKARQSVCAECSAGKHRNCLGVTWDNVADDEVPCPCPHPTHRIGADRR